MYLFPQQPFKLGLTTHKPDNTVGWKLFFWLMLLKVVASAYIIGFMRILQVSPYDYTHFIFSLISCTGLLGFAFYQPVFWRFFWRCFFYLYMFESIVYIAILPMLGIKHFGQPISINANLMLEVIWTILTLYAIFLYAYKKPFVWKEPTGDIKNNGNRHQIPGHEWVENSVEQTSSLKAVLWGAATDIGGTIVFSAFASFLYTIFLASQGYDQARIMEVFINLDTFTTFGLILTSVGLLISFYAGFVCAKKNLANSKRNTVILCAIMSIYCMASSWSQTDLLKSFALTVLTLVALYLGYRYAISKYAQHNNHTSPTP